MTKEQTLTIIQKTNKKANSIDVVETIKNGQNIKYGACGFVEGTGGRRTGNPEGVYGSAN